LIKKTNTDPTLCVVPLLIIHWLWWIY